MQAVPTNKKQNTVADKEQCFLLQFLMVQRTKPQYL